MNDFRSSVDKIFKGALKSVSRFPAAILSALVIAAVAIIKINLNYETQSSYNFLFNTIQISFLFSAVLSMATVIYYEVYLGETKANFALVNVVPIVLGFASFLVLYNYAGYESIYYERVILDIAMARMGVLILASVIGFIYFMSKAKIIDSFSDSFFITHKAFVISALYGLVIMLGVSGVIGAFEALVYRGLNFTIYQYLGVLVMFLSFTLFLGYFPSLKEADFSEEIIEQPRFIVVLFGSILVPILIALTVVLLLWSLQTVLSDVEVSFTQLSGIATAYIFTGLWLHIMVSKYESKLALFYKKLYPYAGLLILMFEAWALFVQINKNGFMTTEYSFLLTWIFAVISMILIILLKNKSYRKISLLAIVLSMIWAMPFIGYQDVGFNSQVKRLENQLIDQGYLTDNTISPQTEIPSVNFRNQVTDRVQFISDSQKVKRPVWFIKELNDNKVFKNTFGFDKIYGGNVEPTDDRYTSYELRSETIDISGYSLSLNMMVLESVDNAYTFKGNKGLYEVQFQLEDQGIPQIKLLLDDNVIIDENLDAFLKNLISNNPSNGNRSVEVLFDDMKFIVENEDVQILMVLNNVDITSNTNDMISNYYVSLQGIYVKFK